MTRNHVPLLDTRLKVFQDYLKQEIQVVLADCIELAFYRCSPEVIGNAELQAENESCDECGEYPCGCDAEHDFESMDHCESCESYWWPNHDLAECLSEGKESDCTRHRDHSGAECEWDCSLHNEHAGADCAWGCPAHSEHELSECSNECSHIHTHEDWHSYMQENEVARKRHAMLFPECQV